MTKGGNLTTLNMYKRGRLEARMTIEEAAEELHIAPRTLAKYEADDTEPSPAMALQMSRVYRQPEITYQYCRNCPIGAVYAYELLNNVDDNITTILVKLHEELHEAAEAVKKAMFISVNKRTREDFDNDEWEKFTKAVHELIDVEHAFEFFKIKVGQITDVASFIHAHNEDCIHKGYALAR